MFVILSVFVINILSTTSHDNNNIIHNITNDISQYENDYIATTIKSINRNIISNINKLVYDIRDDIHILIEQRHTSNVTNVINNIDDNYTLMYNAIYNSISSDMFTITSGTISSNIRDIDSHNITDNISTILAKLIITVKDMNDKYKTNILKIANEIINTNSYRLIDSILDRIT